jgi:hypothetical protein
METESSINPGRWQSDRVGGEAEGHGYSLVQWTPYTKYTEWCFQNGYDDPSEMDSALARINYEVLNNIYHARKNHKLDEWHTLCEVIEKLPYSEFITMDFEEK